MPSDGGVTFPRELEELQFTRTERRGDAADARARRRRRPRPLCGRGRPHRPGPARHRRDRPRRSRSRRASSAWSRPRSGLALKHGITLVNAPGVIDSGFRGELRVILQNTDANSEFKVAAGDRIAQLLLDPDRHGLAARGRLARLDVARRGRLRLQRHLAAPSRLATRRSRPARTALDPAEAGEEAPDARRVDLVGVAVDLAQVGLLDDPDLQLERDDQPDRGPTIEATFGTIIASPRAVGIIAEKIGFLTQANGPDGDQRRSSPRGRRRSATSRPSRSGRRGSGRRPPGRAPSPA